MEKNIKIYKDNIEYVPAKYLIDKYNLPSYELSNLIRYKKIKVIKMNPRMSLFPKKETEKILVNRCYTKKQRKYW